MEQSLPEVRTVDELEGLIEKHRSFLAVLFYTDSSRKSTQAALLLTEIKKDKLDTAVAAVNASRTRDIHPRFGFGYSCKVCRGR